MFQFHFHIEGALHLFLRSWHQSQESWCWSWGAGSSQPGPELTGSRVRAATPHTPWEALLWWEASFPKPVFFKFNGLHPLAKLKNVPKPHFFFPGCTWAPCCLFAVKSQCRFCTPPIPVFVSVPCRIQAEDVSLKALTKLIQLLNLQLCPR